MTFKKLKSWVEKSRFKRLRSYLRKNPHTKRLMKSDNAILLLAWYIGPAVVRFLLAEGVHPDQRDTGDGTVLMYASGEGLIDLVRTLLDFGAEIAATNDDGETPFSWACANNRMEVAQLLAESGANINTVDKGGGTPFDWVLSRGSEDFQSYLRSIGCKRADEIA